MVAYLKTEDFLCITEDWQSLDLCQNLVRGQGHQKVIHNKGHTVTSNISFIRWGVYMEYILLNVVYQEKDLEFFLPMVNLLRFYFSRQMDSSHMMTLL